MGSGFIYSRTVATKRNVKGFSLVRSLFLTGILLLSLPFSGRSQTAPIAASGNTISLSVCQNGSIDISSYLSVNDPDAAQDEIYSEYISPASGGTLSGLPNTINTGAGGVVNITGVVYNPPTGFSGSDNFQVQVDNGADGIIYINFLITVNASPALTITGMPSVCNGTTSSTLPYSSLLNVGVISDTFGSLGLPDHFSVPIGVNTINFDIYGAVGGSDNISGFTNGGLGARVQGVIPVTGGSDQLYIYVGGAGANGSTYGASGGFNGGGNANYDPANGCGGGGGGATDIRLNGFSLADRVAVAGGGGGGGYESNVFSVMYGGDAGDVTGASSSTNNDGSFATGGDQVSPGVGATYTFPPLNPGSNGVGNAGGNGSIDGVSGGGGGGFFGGGGGVYTGGGGGSSFADPIKTNSTTITTGVNSLAGMVVLSYNTVGSYTITYDATAQGQGFINVGPLPIPATEFPIAIPAGAMPAIYNATLTISNSICTQDYAFTVEVKQTPDVNPVTASTYCDGDAVNINFTTNVGTSPTYNWVNDNTAIGAASSGSGNLSFTAANATSGPVSGTFTVTPTEFGCTGASTSFSITTNPLPAFTITNPNIEVCSGVTTKNVDFTGLVNIGSYSNSYSFLGGNPNPQVFVVPYGITSISFDATGAIGGSDDVSPSPNPGKGARVQGVLNVSAGEVLNFYVGGRGFNGSVFGAAGGFNGGGDAYYYPGIGCGGAGGGATDIRANGTALSDRVVIAGGGGGNGWDNFFGAYAGGVGGGLTGGNSQTNKDGGIAYGGSQVIGGAGATYSGGWIPGSAGALGMGGKGSIQGISGGGGGGYYGGGGGMWNGGGGGSSYNDPVTTTLVTHTPGYNNGNGTLTINYTTVATYAIDYDPAAEAEGFVDAPVAVLPSSSFPITIPAGATPNVYNATVTISNGICSNSYPIQITVDALPSVDPTSDQQVCDGTATAAISFSGTPATVFHWNNDNTSIGLAAVDSVDINSFTATNSGTATAVANVVVTPVSAVTGCVGATDTFVLSVYPTPVLNSAITSSVCNNVPFVYTATSATTGTKFNWSRDVVADISNIAATDTVAAINESLVNTTNTVAVAAVYVYTLTANGCMNTEAISVNVQPQSLLMNATTDSVCSGTPWNFVPVPSVSGSTFAWSHNAVSGGTIPATMGTGNISETWSNLNANQISVVYTYTVSANGCDYVSATNPVLIVKPVPKLSGSLVIPAMCSGGTNSYTPTSGTLNFQYSWNRIADPGILPSTYYSASPINETLTNSTALPITVKYEFNLSIDGCAAPAEYVQQDVYPIPAMSSTKTPSAVCSDAAFVYNITSATPSLSYFWNRLPATGITSASAPSGIVNSISQTLTNTTNKAVNVDYLVTLTYGGSCTSTDTVHVTVDPTPKVISSVADTFVCDSLGMGKYMIQSNVAGSSYVWGRDYVEGISNIAASGTSNLINEGLSNTTNVDVTVVYTITPSAGGCVGAPAYRHVTVHPTPRLSSTLTPHYVCSDFPFYYHPTSYVDGTTFDWKRDTVNGIIPATSFGSGDVWGGEYNTLIATDFKYHYVTYKFRLSANGCVNQFFDQVKLLVNPAPKLPAISSNIPDGPCSNMMYQTFEAAAPPDAGVQFDWSATNAQVWSSTANHQHAYVNFYTPGTSYVIMKGTILATGCIYKDSLRVNVGYGVADAPRIIFHQGQFICLQSDMDSYQWGCDDIETYASTPFQGATEQNLYLPVPDFQHKRYWVMTIHNGCKQKSYYNAPTGVENVNNDVTEVKVFPNPTQDNINVEINTTVDGKVTVDVVDMLGQKISTVQAVNHSASINVSNLAAGCYFVDCYRDGVKIATSRFVKN